MASSTANISGDGAEEVTPPAPKTEPAKSVAPKAEAPKVETPKAEAPVVEAPIPVQETPLEFLSGEALFRAQEGVRVG
jgi:hypothetical protein